MLKVLHSYTLALAAVGTLFFAALFMLVQPQPAAAAGAPTAQVSLGSVSPDDPNCITDWSVSHSTGWINFSVKLISDPCSREVHVLMSCHDLNTDTDFWAVGSNVNTVGATSAASCKGLYTITYEAEVLVYVPGEGWVGYVEFQDG